MSVHIFRKPFGVAKLTAILWIQSHNKGFCCLEDVMPTKFEYVLCVLWFSHLKSASNRRIKVLNRNAFTMYCVYSILYISCRYMCSYTHCNCTDLASIDTNVNARDFVHFDSTTKWSLLLFLHRVENNQERKKLNDKFKSVHECFVPSSIY